MSLRREPSSPPMRRIRALVAVAALAVAGAVATAVPATPAGASDVPSWLSTINSFRQSKGLAPFTLDAELSALAQQQTQAMAGQGKLFHSPNLAAGISANWTKLGENVGMGANLDIIWQAFLNSPPHYNNLVDPAYTHVGIGVVIVGHTQWVTHRFMGVGAAPPPVVAQPQAQPQPAPVVVAPPTTAPRPTTPPATRPAPVTTSTTAVPVPVTVAPEPVIVPAASAPERAAALLDALHRFER